MTLKEAQLFFPYQESDDLTDLMDERLFEYKQFFLSKTPIRKVFEAKLDKLRQLNEAYLTLTQAASNNKISVPQESVNFSDEVLTAFKQWETYKSQFKQQLMTAFEAHRIEEVVINFLVVVDAYRLKWETNHEIEVEIETLSKDADPMYVLEAIKAFNLQGGIYFHDIVKLGNNSFLLKEMKRLSLLSKKYGDVRNI